MSLNCLLRDLPKLACVKQCLRRKHYDIKWRQLRKEKVMKIDLPDYDKVRRDSKLPPDEYYSMLKKEGIAMPRHFQERQLIVACTGDIIEPYVPPKGDGISSRLSGKGASEKIKEISMKGKSMLQLRKIKPFEEDFDPKIFAGTALDIYKEAFNLLQDIKKNELRLHELLSEKAYPELTWKLDKKTFRWHFVESIEPPKVVHVRTQEVMSKENVYAQVTVRFHSKLLISIYDRFGRLAFGSENYPFEMVEYVVYEKHLSNEYGTWRIHGKIVPEWSSKSDDFEFAVLRTSVKPKLEAIETKSEPTNNDGLADRATQSSGEVSAA